MVSSRLAIKLEEIADADSYRDVVFKLVDWAEMHGLLGELVMQARAHNPAQPELRAFAEQIGWDRDMASRGMSAPIRDTDPYAVTMLPDGSPFLGRNMLRAELRNLSRPGGVRVLVVQGAEGVGKSYSLRLIMHLSRVLGTFKVAWIDLDQEAYVMLGPGELARHLATQIGRNPDSLPAEEPQTNRWVLRLGDWLIAQLNHSSINWWFVLDGFDHPDVPIETQEFISVLVRAAAEGQTGLRVVLLGNPDLLIPNGLEPYIARERVVRPDRDDVAACFCQLARSGAIRIGTNDVAQVVDAVMRAGGENAHALNAAVSRAVQLLN
jgi:hypothetical protein